MVASDGVAGRMLDLPTNMPCLNISMYQEENCRMKNLGRKTRMGASPSPTVSISDDRMNKDASPSDP
jgi:hypothetical protein